MSDESRNTESPKPRKRMLRFGLLSLFLLLTIAAIAFSFVFGDVSRLAAANTFLEFTNTGAGQSGLKPKSLPAWQLKIYGEEKLRPASSILIYKETKTDGTYWKQFAKHSASFPEVRSLVINRVQIPVEAGAVIKNFSNLEQLTFTLCEFESIEVLDNLHQAKFVYFDQCQVGLEDVERLRTKFPNTFFVANNAGPEYQSPILRR